MIQAWRPAERPGPPKVSAVPIGERVQLRSTLKRAGCSTTGKASIRSIPRCLRSQEWARSSLGPCGHRRCELAGIIASKVLGRTSKSENRANIFEPARTTSARSSRARSTRDEPSSKLGSRNGRSSVRDCGRNQRSDMAYARAPLLGYRKIRTAAPPHRFVSSRNASRVSVWRSPGSAALGSSIPDA